MVSRPTYLIQLMSDYQFAAFQLNAVVSYCIVHLEYPLLLPVVQQLWSKVFQLNDQVQRTDLTWFQSQQQVSLFHLSLENQLNLVASVSQNPIDHYVRFDRPTFLYLWWHRVPIPKNCTYDQPVDDFHPKHPQMSCPLAKTLYSFVDHKTLQPKSSQNYACKFRQL